MALPSLEDYIAKSRMLTPPADRASVAAMDSTKSHLFRAMERRVGPAPVASLIHVKGTDQRLELRIAEATRYYLRNNQGDNATAVMAHEIRSETPAILIHSQLDTTQFPVGSMPHHNLARNVGKRQCSLCQ